MPRVDTHSKHPPDAWKRSIGFVTKIRVRPKDVMSCIDVVNATNSKMEGMSLSAVVSKGIAIAFHTLRSEKVIPDRDGFEYNEMVAPYKILTRVEKVVAGHKMVLQAQHDEITDAPQPRLVQGGQERYLRPEDTPQLTDAQKQQRVRAYRQIKELEVRKEHDPVNWKPEHQKEYDRLRKFLLAV